MDAICVTLPRVAAEQCPDMEDMAQSVANKYGRALMLHSKCHEQFNSSNTFSDKTLVSLRKFRIQKYKKHVYYTCLAVVSTYSSQSLISMTFFPIIDLLSQTPQ